MINERGNFVSSYVLGHNLMKRTFQSMMKALPKSSYAQIEIAYLTMIKSNQAKMGSLNTKKLLCKSLWKSKTTAKTNFYWEIISHQTKPVKATVTFPINTKLPWISIVPKKYKENKNASRSILLLFSYKESLGRNT